MAAPDKKFRQYISDEFLVRKNKNPSYSLRAYARDLSIPVSRLSEIMNGKAGISEARAVDLAEKLKLSAEDRSLFVDLVQSEHSRSPLAKKSANIRMKVREIDHDKIDDDQFALISEWYHMALMELLKIEAPPHKLESLSARLGIDVDLVAAALHRLERLGFLEKKNDHYALNKKGGAISREVPSPAIRHFHHQVLKKSDLAIDHKPLAERDLSAVVFTFDKKNMQAVKERIRKFRRELMSEYQVSGEPDSVYCMAVQFFELTEKL